MPTIARPTRAPRRRAKSWVMRHDGDDEYSVLRNGRQLRTGVSSLIAQKFIAQHREPGQRVFAEDPDGSRVEITRRF